MSTFYWIATLFVGVFLFFSCTPESADNVIVELHDDSDLNQVRGRFVHSSFNSTTKGEVHYTAYLPPEWTEEDTTTYPLLIYLYGQGGNEYSFSKVVRDRQLNQWINAGLISPMVIICVRGEERVDGKWSDQKIQWYTSENQKLLLNEDDGELRAFCRTKFRAGMSSDQISLEGQSRGASGTLYYAMNHPDKFSSFIADAYVSDYTLGSLKSSARENKERLSQGINLRMEIGTKDYWVHKYGRKGTFKMHDFLTDLEIPHEYDTLVGRNHGLKQFWYHPRHGYPNNGFFHLKFHERAWKGK